MEAFNEAERRAFDEFSARVAALNQDDAARVRFLRARKFDVDAAVKQIEEAVAWRVKFGADGVLDGREIPKTELMKKCVPHLFHGHDKAGRPLYIERTGKVDVPRMMNLFTRDELMLHHVVGQEYQLKRCRESSAARGKMVVDTCMIMDLTGMNMSHKRGMDFLKFLTEHDQMAYPEMLGKLYVINAPWMFNILWKVAKHWLDAHTRSKIHIVGGDYKAVLLADIDASDLPREFGGESETEVPAAGAAAEVSLEEFDPELTEEDVPAGKTLERRLRVDDKEGGSFSWFFRTAAKDIRFSATFVPDRAVREAAARGADAKPEVIVAQAPERFNASEARVEGTFSSEEPGEMVYLWDNSYSWTSSKRVRFNIGVETNSD